MNTVHAPTDENRTETAGQQKPRSPRMPEQDIAKGLAILMVLALHTLMLHKGIFTIVSGMFGFIMPFFFFMAGYNHRPYRYTYGQIIRKRARQILVPFFVYSLAITVLAGAYYLLTGQLTLKQVSDTYLLHLLSRPTGRMLGIESASGLYSCIMMFWFIQMLFTASLVFYAVADYALASVPRLISVFFGLIMVTMVFAHFDLRLPWYLSEAPAIGAMMLMGAFFGQKDLLSNRTPKRSIIINSVVSYAVFMALAVTFRTGFIMGGTLWDTKFNEWKEWTVLLSVVYAIAGTYPFVHFCRCLIHTGPLAKALIWCGNNSMKLLFIHGVVQLFVCAVLGLEPFRMSLTSESNDFRTFYVLALEILISVLVILCMDKMKKRPAAGPGAKA